MKLKLSISLIILLVVSSVAQAGYYGQRNWLWQNAAHNRTPEAGPSVHEYSWGYNYRANGRHTTVQLEEDKTGWMYNGNARTNTDTGTYLWGRFKSAK